ncbi:PREDICTED: stromal cell-derived factor 1 [Myotis davidii]|uniref:stromal cell-derived factor 1 n=1 Tax=Myotis davidii TaxID=225400 RepID=UPI0003EC3FD3|nr:PREDICTED: stromal cell-derived factor 1 [Myotis davidii]
MVKAYKSHLCLLKEQGILIVGMVTMEQAAVLFLLPLIGKPVSLSYRCPCRFFESHVARANVKHLKILNTPNCALQIVAKLKNNNRQVCIDPKLKWIQEYLEKALNKVHRTGISPHLPLLLPQRSSDTN